jgi:ribonuclease BN (tRNA processing enzyme)
LTPLTTITSSGLMFQAIIGLTRKLCLALIAILSSAAPSWFPAPPLRSHVILLGTGTPNADPTRSGPAVAIVVDSNTYIVDAGPGIVRRAAAAKITMPSLRLAFLTHLHSDHTVGLPDLMFSPWVLGRTVPLVVYGPPGTTAMVDHLQAAYAEDIDIRLHGGEPSNKTGYGGRGHDMAAGVVYRDSLVTITAFEVPHGKWPHAYGYRFQTPDRTIVISGDTSPSDAVANACDGCDVLVHEIISSESLEGRTADWQAYHRAYHTPGYELGDVATKARPKLLLLYHQIPSGIADSVLLREVHARYRGVVVSGKDLGVY